MNPKMLKEGGVGTSAAYVILVAPTEWLGVLPAIPDGQLIPLVAALGGVLTAIITKCNKEKSDA